MRCVMIAIPFALAVFAVAQDQQAQGSSQIQKETALGRALGQQLERSDGLIDDGAISGYAQQIVNRIAPAVPAQAFEVRITRSEQKYAWLLPGGLLYLSGGLFEQTENEAQLAGLLAHVLAHPPLTLPPASPGTIVLIGSQCALLAPAALVFRRAPRMRESEARAMEAGFAALKRSGYDPSVGLDLLLALNRGPCGGSKFLSEDEILNLMEIARTDVAPPGGYRVDSAEFVARRASVSAALGHGPRQAPPPTLFRDDADGVH